jgi:hypothetical protein
MKERTILGRRSPGTGMRVAAREGDERRMAVGVEPMFSRSVVSSVSPVGLE